jgi:tRNA G37 N-methylase Trm5
LEPYIQEGDICVDATAGNGSDTQFLCEKVGQTGFVYAFDIQPIALQHTQERLQQVGYEERVSLILDGHEKMEAYVKEDVSAILFNFGYLPGGDHAISTHPKTSIDAILAGMELLKVGGILSLCIYSGRKMGYEEKDAILEFLSKLDGSRWLVLVHQFYNRKNDPPIPAFVIRLR